MHGGLLKDGRARFGDFAHAIVYLQKGDVSAQEAMQNIALRRPDYFWTGGAMNGDLLEERRARF